MNADLQQAMAQLAMDIRFKLFMSAIVQMREAALAEAVSNQAVANERVTAAYLGEIRAYRDIEAVYAEALRAKGGEPEQSD